MKKVPTSCRGRRKYITDEPSDIPFTESKYINSVMNIVVQNRATL